MSDPEGIRKLEAILAADVAGYSRLMQEDDEATVATLEAYRGIFRERIQAHRGRVVDMAGDSVLAVFDAATGAVRAASEIQVALAERNDTLPEARRMRFRIGVNLGEVIERPDGTVYGDGVNIAARLESLAEAGGICVSGTVYDQVEGKSLIAFKFAGEQAVKNIAKPVRTYHAVMDIRRDSRPVLSPTETDVERTLQPPDEPSIAVLPFANLSGKPEDEPLADGMTETLITDLSRLNNLFVIARNSTFTYKGKSVDVRRVGEELGVRYVLEGSVQRIGTRLRVNAQLIEAQAGRHLWAERYDRTLADVFDIQDDLAQRIVTELDVKLLKGEQGRTWRKATRNPQAYDLFLTGLHHYNRFNREDNAIAQTLFQDSLELDPNFTMGVVYLGWTHAIQGRGAWSADPEDSYLKALALGRKAAEMDPSLADAANLLSGVLLSQGNHAEAVAAADKALALNPNQADILAWSAFVLAVNGRAAEAVSLVERALRRNPFSPDWYFNALGVSLLFSHRPKEALSAYRKCVDRVPDYLPWQLGLTVAYVGAGKIEQAKAQAREVLRINPKITAQDSYWVRAIASQEERASVIDALRRAGLK
jgi:adenylate cyclase